MYHPSHERTQRTVLRAAWILGVAFLVGVPGLYLAATDVNAGYTAEGTLRIDGASRRQGPGDGESAPPGGRPDRDAWGELLRSYQVLDPVMVAQGVADPRQASRELANSLETVMDPGGGFLRVVLEGPDEQAIVDVLNAVMERYVVLAGELKRAQLEETLALLQEGLQTAELALAQAERELEEFRVGTIGASPDPSPAGAGEAGEAARLKRNVQAAEAHYREVRANVRAARLAATAAVPDVRILDHASIENRRRNGLRLPVVAAIVAICLGLAAGGALITDRMTASLGDPP